MSAHRASRDPVCMSFWRMRASDGHTGKSHRPQGSEGLTLTLRPCPNWALSCFLIILSSNKRVLPQALYQDLEMSANSPPQGAPSPRERSHHWTVLSAERLDSAQKVQAQPPLYYWWTMGPWQIIWLLHLGFFTYKERLPHKIVSGIKINNMQSLTWHRVSLQKARALTSWEHRTINASKALSKGLRACVTG